MQFDIYRITGHDVGYLHGKYVGALLFKEGRAFSLAFSGGEFLARLFLFLYPGSDGLVSNLHFHTVDRNPGGGRKDIACIYRDTALISIGLGNIGFGYDAVYGG